jgi:hypothetical protein
MPKAILTMDDRDGKLELSLFLEGGFQVDSDAHQCANLLVKHLDTLGAVEGQSEVRELTGEEAEAVIRDAQQIQTVAQAAVDERPALTLVRPN